MKRRDYIIKSTFATSFAFFAPQLVTQTFAQERGELVLVDETTIPQIIIPETATEAEKFAAQELATYLQKISAKTIIITATNTLASVETISIILGNHPLNADLHPEKLEVEEATINIEKDRLRITGGWDPTVTNSKGVVSVRDRGVMYGVYELLDRLGVRWFRPDEWGEHVPQMSRIQLPLGKSTFKPAYKYRTGFNTYRNKSSKKQADMAQLWAHRNRHAASRLPGGSYGIYVGANLSNLVPFWKYGKEHPEYFALVKDKRQGPHICMGNSVVQELVAQILIKFAKENPTQTIRSIEPFDSSWGYCECELCTALDDPKLISPVWKKPSITNRMAYFGNYVARRLREEGQTLSISWYAYSVRFEVPTKFTKMEPNIFVGPTSIGAAYGDYSKLLDDPKVEGNVTFTKLLTGWGKLVQLFTRDFWSGGCWFGPLPYLTFLTDRTRNYRKYGVQGIVNEVHPSWGAQTMAHYFAVRLQNNPDIDVEKELKYFCDSYYGPAGKPMLEYYQIMEKASLAGPAYFFSGRFIDRLFTDDNLLDQLNPLIEESKKLIGDKQPYAKRFEGMEAGHEVANVRNLAERHIRERNTIAASHLWRALEQKIRANTEGDIFDIGLIKYVWRTMSSESFMQQYGVRVDKFKEAYLKNLLQDLTTNWKFSQDPHDIGFKKGAHESTFIDSNWPTLNTSSSWRDQGQNYQGNAWYRKSFNIDKKETAKRYAVFFHEIKGDALIYLNGSEIGRLEFVEKKPDDVNDLILDITSNMSEGKNVIAVQITNPPPSPGIIKGVSLLMFDPIN